MDGSCSDHYGMWWAAAVWIILYGVMILFTPFYRKSRVKPVKTYMAFVTAFALEMFGIPFSMYAAGWIFGITLPEGVFNGHTLYRLIGYRGMYAGLIMMTAGSALVISGWGLIHDRYWRKESGEGELVVSGIYKYIRHPQYAGLFLITLGMIAEWATIPLVLMWPYLVFIYYRLAKKEEADMILEFGSRYRSYAAETGMFFPVQFFRKKVT